MDLDNTKSNEIIHKEFKKCGFCGEELIPIDLIIYMQIFLQMQLNTKDVIAMRHKNTGTM